MRSRTRTNTTTFPCWSAHSGIPPTAEAEWQPGVRNRRGKKLRPPLPPRAVAKPNKPTNPFPFAPVQSSDLMGIFAGLADHGVEQVAATHGGDLMKVRNGHGTGTWTGEHRPPTQRAGERDGQTGGPTGNEKAARRAGLERLETGGVGPGRGVGPANQGRSRTGRARRRSAGTVEGGLPPQLRHARQGRIYCTARLLTHRRLGCRIAVTHCLEGG